MRTFENIMVVIVCLLLGAIPISVMYVFNQEKTALHAQYKECIDSIDKSQSTEQFLVEMKICREKLPR